MRCSELHPPGRRVAPGAGPRRDGGQRLPGPRGLRAMAARGAARGVGGVPGRGLGVPRAARTGACCCSGTSAAGARASGAEVRSARSGSWRGSARRPGRFGSTRISDHASALEAAGVQDPVGDDPFRVGVSLPDRVYSTCRIGLARGDHERRARHRLRSALRRARAFPARARRTRSHASRSGIVASRVPARRADAHGALRGRCAQQIGGARHVRPAPGGRMALPAGRRGRQPVRRALRPPGGRDRASRSPRWCGYSRGVRSSVSSRC